MIEYHSRFYNIIIPLDLLRYRLVLSLNSNITLFRAVRWEFIASVEMRRITPDGDEVEQKIYLRSGAHDLFSGDDIAEAIDEGINRLLENLSTFESQGSGWTLVAVDRLEVSTAQFNPIGGSSYIPTPKRIANTQTCLNVENKEDELCFLYAIAASVLNLNHRTHAIQALQISRFHFWTEN